MATTSYSVIAGAERTHGLSFTIEVLAENFDHLALKNLKLRVGGRHLYYLGLYALPCFFIPAYRIIRHITLCYYFFLAEVCLSFVTIIGVYGALSGFVMAFDSIYNCERDWSAGTVGMGRVWSDERFLVCNAFCVPMCYVFIFCGGGL